MKKKIRFILNPIAGKGRTTHFPEIIKQVFANSDFDFEILFTEYSGHLKMLTAEAVAKNYYAVVVAGGDGTIHEAAQSLVHSDTILGILPAGSGNGFANHFSIPHQTENALKVILQKNISIVDTLSANGTVCVATAGLGFDAHIAHQFSKLKTRGFLSYIKLTLKEFFAYKESEYSITSAERDFKQKAFLVAVANTSEYGNHAAIAPEANVKDGLLNVCLLKGISLFNFPLLAFRLFTKNIHHSGNYKSFTSESVTISCSSPLPFHVDGEPMPPVSKLNVAVVPASLRLFIPALK